eukprot:6188794-Pleurochrysis_carterae.AAC.3
MVRRVDDGRPGGAESDDDWNQDRYNMRRLQYDGQTNVSIATMHTKRTAASCVKSSTQCISTGIETAVRSSREKSQARL